MSERHIGENRPRGWSGSETLIMRNRLKALTVAAKFDDPGPYTIQFFTKVNDSPLAFVRSLAEAIIEWSVEGNTTTRRVTVANGLSVSGTAEAFRVTIRDATLLAGGAFPVGFDPEYLVSCGVVKGNRAAIQQPPILIPPSAEPVLATDWVQGRCYILAGTQSPILTIPSDAGVISLAVTACAESGGVGLPNGSVQVRQVCNGGLLKVYDPRDYGVWVPVAPNAETFAIQNSSAQDIMVSAIYGIDG